MKTKILIVLFCFFFGMVQNAIGQEPDSLNVKIDTIVFDSNAIDTLFISKQLDSLKVVYQLRNQELLNIKNQIDSLEFVLKPVIQDNSKKDFLISNYDLEFTIVSCDLYMNEVRLVANIKNLKDAEILLRVDAEVYDGLLIKDYYKGSVPLFHSQILSSDDENISLTITIDKKRWKIKKAAIKMDVSLQIKKHIKYKGKYNPFNIIEWEKMRRKELIFSK